MATCGFTGCDRPHKGHGLCQAHLRQQNLGQELRPLINKTRPSKNRVCSFEGCGKKHFANGLCQGHNTQKRNGKELVPLRPERDPICTFPGCERKHVSQGLCSSHNGQLERGKPLTPIGHRVCQECGCTFESNANTYCCDSCYRYPAERRRLLVRLARKGWETSDYEERREYVEILNSDPCVYCGSRERLELEHIEALILGGEDTWENLASICRFCNASKQHRSILVYMLERLEGTENVSK
jgi:hypothetical protein